MSDDLADETENVLSSPTADVAVAPNDAADPPSIVRQKIPPDLFEKYEFHSYRNAAVILAESNPAEFLDLLETLRNFTITTDIIRKAGGNESEIPKILSSALRPKGWHETRIQGDLTIRLICKEQKMGEDGKRKTILSAELRKRENYLDGHKIDYVKNRVAFDLEWNSKDQTFDRDLYAFNAFSQCGVVDAGVLLTRSGDLNDVFRALGQALDSNGQPELDKKGRAKTILQKYGASTTWMGKLLYRLNAGRNGGCPVLAVGIRPACISDWSPS